MSCIFTSVKRTILDILLKTKIIFVVRCFFFQAEDGIREGHVTGVQTCALPIYLERCLLRPRHIEVQVLADAGGRVVHLYERDCSIQRRNQKLVEVAPSPGLTPAQRAEAGALAVRAAEAIGYENAGTVEFWLGGGQLPCLRLHTRTQI